MKMFLKGFVFAGRGVWFCLRHERNFRIHLVVAAYVICFAFAFSLSRAEWAVLLLTIGMVIAAEAVNTAVEHMVDLLSPGENSLARAAKDIAAGAVLVCAVISIGVGVALFGRPEVLFALGIEFIESPWMLILLILSIFLALLFIVCGGIPKGNCQQKKMDSSFIINNNGNTKIKHNLNG